MIGDHGGALASFALFFHNFSTILGWPEIYLEDLYVRSEHRRSGVGRALLGNTLRPSLGALLATG